MAISQDDVKEEALVVIKQERDGNPQENRVEEIQAEESTMSLVLKEMRSMREEIKAGKEEMKKKMEQEMKGVREETNEKRESVFEEMTSVKDELREARKEIAALKQRYKFQKKELKAAVRLWCTDRNKAIAQFGHISGWNISSITSMRRLFGQSKEDREQGNHWNKDFNEDLSLWDTSNVTNMAWMFNEASSFNIDVSRWNVGNCTNMSAMFQNAKSFQSDLKGWNVEKVTSMDFMFKGAASFESDCSRWSTGNCTNIFNMFFSASSFNRDTIKNWDLSSIKGSRVRLKGREPKKRTRGECMP